MPPSKPVQSNFFTKGSLAVCRLFTAIFLFIKTLFLKPLDALDKFAQGLKRKYYSLKNSINTSLAKSKKRYTLWRKNVWEKTHKPSLKKFLKSAFDFLIIVIMYGLMVNYMASIFYKFPFTIKTVIAFGIAVYFVKYEITEIIIKIRGPKIPPIVMP